eukprot:1133157-Prymnesium_polylepis.1
MGGLGALSTHYSACFSRAVAWEGERDGVLYYIPYVSCVRATYASAHMRECVYALLRRCCDCSVPGLCVVCRV